MMRPTYGSILIDEVHARLSRKVSFMAQEGSSFPELTIDDHFDFLTHSMMDFRAERFERLISFFDLPRGQKLGHFSTGQRSSFELCCGLSLARPYLIMDEPFLGHDLITRQNTLKLLAGLLGEQDTLILSTHQVQEAEPLISRAIVLDKGRIIADVQMEELRARHLQAKNAQGQSKSLLQYLEVDRKNSDKKLAEILQAEWSE
jgi:ABC-2 type transport system ATP-binding protein